MSLGETGNNRYGSFFIWVVLCVVLAVTALYTFKRPAYNWDMLAYMAIVAGADHQDAKSIHSFVYQEVKKEVPAGTYQLLTDTTHPYRKKMLNEPESFAQQRPFYIVKPLYVALVFLFYKVGFTLVQATILPSTLAFFLIGVLLFIWVSKYLKPVFALLVCLSLMLSNPLFNAAKLSTPDILSALMLCLAAYSIIELRSAAAIFTFLILAVFARIDSILPATLLLTLLYATRKQNHLITRWQYLLMLSGLILSYFVITSLTLKNGWNILYYPTFSGFINSSHGVESGFSFKDYLFLLYSGVMTGLLTSHVMIFVAVALLTLSSREKIRRGIFTFDQLFLVTILFAMGLRFVLHTAISDRFYLAYYIIIVMLAIRRFFLITNPENK
jgi:hypothetical protein